jgi:hypothetical protein
MLGDASWPDRRRRFGGGRREAAGRPAPAAPFQGRRRTGIAVSVDDRALTRQLAWGRIAAGVGLLAVPGLVGGAWIGRRTASDPGARVLLRALGVRDLVLGLGLKTALDRDAPTRGWLEGGLAADCVDFSATVLAGDDLPLTGRALVGALAGSGVALGAWLRRAAEVGPAAPEAVEHDAASAGAATLSSP